MKRLTPPDNLDKSSQSEVQMRMDDALASLALSLARTRSEAIQNRQTCGIEDEWTEDLEHYEGIDDANRGESRSWRTKPPGQVMLKVKGSESTIFTNITRIYADNAAARMGDVLLPTGEAAWDIKETPVPELLPVAQGTFSPRLERQMMEQAQGNDKSVQAMRDQAVSSAVDMLDEARSKARKAKKRIEDRHAECQYQAENRKVLDDITQVGTGILKGPVMVRQRQLAFIEGALVIRDEDAPASMRSSYWNCYPDLAGGDNIHNGSYHWERDDLTKKSLQALKGGTGYLDDQIDLCLAEGPAMATETWPARLDALYYDVQRQQRNLYEIWYGYMQIEREDLAAAGFDLPEDAPGIPGHVQMVNNRIIKIWMNPLDTGKFPYDYMIWQRRPGLPWGTGVSRQIRTPQRIVKAAVRMMMDNAGIAGGPMIVVKRGLVEPHNNKWEIRARKVWFAKEDAELEHLDNAFRVVKIDMVQPELQAIVELGMRLAEDVTGIPMLMQGQMGSRTPDTVGGMQLLYEGASSTLRRIARLYDNLITEPHLRRYYEFLMQYGEDEEKGDFVIEAKGSSALVERDIQRQSLMMLGQMVKDPSYGYDPTKWADQMVRAMRLDPEDFKFDDEQWQEIVQNLAQGPQDNQMAVAQLKASLEQWKKQFDGQIKQAEMQWKSSEAERDREMQMVLASLDSTLAQLETGSQDKQNLDKIKGDLSKTVMTIRAQMKMAGMPSAKPAPQIAAPIAEPPGRAKEGRAFQE